MMVRFDEEDPMEVLRSDLGDDGETLLKAVVLQFTGTAAQGIAGIGLTVTNKENARVFTLETQAGGFTEDLSKDIPIIPRPERFPVGGISDSSKKAWSPLR
jgi:hypothetical protein